jgi:hypothetical protein
MNGTATKLANRQIRRAFGEEALQTINQQGETLQSIVLPRLMTAGKSLQKFDERIGALEDARTRQHEEVAFLSKEQADFRCMSRWQRIRWVLGW